MNDLGWDIEKDLSRIRDYEYNDKKFIITASDPYGFCKISLPKGATPKILSGEYTSFMQAEIAIKSYMNKPTVFSKVTDSATSASDNSR